MSFMVGESKYFTREQKELLGRISETLYAIGRKSFDALREIYPNFDRDSMHSIRRDMNNVFTFKDGKSVTSDEWVDDLKKAKKSLPEELRGLVPTGKGFSDDAEVSLELGNKITGLIDRARRIHSNKLAAHPASPAANKAHHGAQVKKLEAEFDTLWREASIAMRGPIATVMGAVHNVVKATDLGPFYRADAPEKVEALAAELIAKAARAAHL